MCNNKNIFHGTPNTIKNTRVHLLQIQKNHQKRKREKNTNNGKKKSKPSKDRSNDINWIFTCQQQ